jgi:lipoprotein-anchoring transpeptidase ErfK/SrfK
MGKAMSKKSFKIALVAALSVVVFGASAKAEVIVDVDISTQTMHVEAAAGSYDWPVSTARVGFSTPRGHFAPTGMERMHYSKKYHNSPMPYSIFFRGGYAIHGTYALSALGAPASHGCVRLSPEHAKMLYEMVQNEGARISIRGSSSRYANR